MANRKYTSRDRESTIAAMASPFISTIVDSLSLLIYFQFASMILGL